MFRFSGKRKSSKSEKELLLSYKRTEDIGIIGELYDKYVHLVYGICLKYLKNREDSKDAVMQIFEKIIIELKEKEVMNFQSWLYVVSKNFCLMKLRKSDKYLKFDIADDNTQNIIMESSNELHLNNELKLDYEEKIVKKCLENLSVQQRQCVQLFYYDEKCYREISEITRYDLNKVKSYIQNGKRNLKNCIESHHVR